ncbi:Ciliary basal body-associated B9 family protein [Brugia pahangi]
MPEQRGVYFANSPLTGVKFRLVLEYNEPVADVPQSLDNFTENTSEKSVPALSTTFVEECTFRWQQKLYHKFTTVPQSQTEGCSKQGNVSQDEITMAVEKDGSRVFTLIDGEKPTGTAKTTTKLNIAKGENSLAERIATSKNRRVEPAVISHRKPIIDLPRKEHQIKTRSVERNKQMMYIMAYLGPLQNNRQICDESNQYVLCKMTAINGTNIIIEPDLLAASNTIESCHGIYKARLSLISNEKFDRIDDASAYQLWFEKGESDTMGDFPSGKTTKLVYLIDIERAVNFPHDGLCIEYKIDLPLQCALIDLSPVHRWSTVIDSSPQGEDDVAVFSQPVSITLIVKAQEQFFENFFWPRMIFRLSGEDCWGCFFGSIISSIGHNTVSSGTLKINVQCIMQSREFICHEFFYKMKYGTLIRHDGMQSRIHWNIFKVLSRFEEARRNLLKIQNKTMPTVNNKIS